MRPRPTLPQPTLGFSTLEESVSGGVWPRPAIPDTGILESLLTTFTEEITGNLPSR